MKKNIVLIVFLTVISCIHNQSEVTCKLSLDKGNGYVYVNLYNDSNSDLYFKAKGLVIDKNDLDSVSFINVFAKLDSVYESQDVKYLKKEAYKNYLLASKLENNNTGDNILIGDSIEYDMSLFEKNYKDVICTLFFFIKSKQHLVLRYTLENFETSINGTKINFENWQNSDRKDFFYSHGKIGNYYPYAKNIESKPIIMGF